MKGVGASDWLGQGQLVLELSVLDDSGNLDTIGNQYVRTNSSDNYSHSMPCSITFCWCFIPSVNECITIESKYFHHSMKQHEAENTTNGNIFNAMAYFDTDFIGVESCWLTLGLRLLFLIANLRVDWSRRRVLEIV